MRQRRLEFDELLRVRPDAIANRAAEPAPFDLPDWPAQNGQATRDWQEATELVKRNTTTAAVRKANGLETLNRATLDFIRDGAATGDRHRLLFSAAANLAEFGCPAALTHALLTEAALDSGLPPAEVRRQIECGLLHR